MKNDDYITKEYFDTQLNSVLDRRFDEFEKRLEQKFDDFAIVVAKGFSDVYKKFDEQREYMDSTFATKQDLYEMGDRLCNRILKIEKDVRQIHKTLNI